MIMSKYITPILTIIYLFAFSSLTNASLITNGSFEQLEFADKSIVRGTVHNTNLSAFASKSRGWDVFYSLPGWVTSHGNGIELQKRVVTRAQDGNHHVELDSHPRGASNAVMTQTIGSLTVGADYLLEFYYKPRTKRQNDNGINVYWYDSAFNFDCVCQRLLLTLGAE